MFFYTHPRFNEGRILKKEMFKNIRDYPKNFVDIYFKNHSNGIILGADILVEKDYLIITEGMVKHSSRIYTLAENYRLPYYDDGKETLIKIRFIDKSKSGDFEFYNTEIFLDQDTFVKRDELELGRFKLRKGSKLKTNHHKFEELYTEYNNVNIINVEYSSCVKSTLSPKILRAFSKEILKSKNKNIYDINFAMQCMNKRALERKIIILYISNRLQIKYKKYSNMEIYNHLKSILKEVRDF